MSAETATAEAASTPDQPIISIKAVHKSFSDLEVLKGVSIDVMKGEVICIIGPSGSGKSTLIRCINALNDIQSGAIQVEGQEVHDANLDKLELRKKVGMVFQQDEAPDARGVRAAGARARSIRCTRSSAARHLADRQRVRMRKSASRGLPRSPD